jgi:hypothetical protein
MDKVLNFKNISLYKEAARILEINNISFEKSELIENPELCMEIIKMLDYFDQKEKCKINK